MRIIEQIFDLDKFQEIWYAIKKNKLRTFLTAFGVFWGIFMLIIMLGSGTGLENGVTQGFGDFATNSCFIWTQRTTMPYKGFPRGRYYNFDNDDIFAITSNISNIKYLAPRLEAGGFRGGDNVVRGKNTGAFSIYGDYPDYNLIDPVNVIDGRFINYLDLEMKRKVVTIGSRVKEVLFEADENPIGEYIKINGVYFQVVGITKSKKSGEEAQEDNQSIYMPFTTMQRTYNYGNTVGWFAITVEDNILVENVEEEIKALLRKRHSVHPDDKHAVGSFNVQKEFKQMKGIFIGVDALIWIVGIGTLLAGIIGVSNIMLIIVKERTKEIGIQRAIGATPFNIITQIITESVFLTSMAGYIGLVIGVTLVELINIAMAKSGADTGMFSNPEVDFNIAITALCILIVAGAFAGLIPAKRAINIKPVEALKDE